MRLVLTLKNKKKSRKKKKKHCVKVMQFVIIQLTFTVAQKRLCVRSWGCHTREECLKHDFLKGNV